MNDLADLGKSADPSILILTSLIAGPKHGYAIAKDVDDFAGVALGPGTLYGALARLESRALIQATPSDQRRRPYEITDAGRLAASRQLRAMQSVASAGLSRLATA